MSKLLATFLVFATLCFATLPGGVANAQDFTVEVVVANPGDSQRASAYWLALNRVLQRNMPAGAISDDQRKEILREPSRYVQSFRYRAYSASQDSGRLSTRQVREGEPPDSVVAVSFPATLLGNLQRQFQAPVAEEVISPGTGRILALVAVDQGTDQFLIGGARATKFQSRMIQLGAANNMSFEFPQLDETDLSIVSPANVLFYDQPVVDAMLQKYQSTGTLTGALVRLSEQSWQSDWNYRINGAEDRKLSLTTRSLDEALVTAVTEIANLNGATGGGYLSGLDGFDRSGVAIRVENINSLSQHQQVLSLLRSIETSVVTESLEPGVTVFRAPQADVFSLQQRLSNQSALTPQTSSDFGQSGESITYRLR